MRAERGERSPLRGRIVVVSRATEADAADIAEKLAGGGTCRPDPKRSEEVVARENGRLIGFGVLETAGRGPSDTGCVTVAEFRHDGGMRQTLLDRLLEQRRNITTVYSDLFNEKGLAGLGFQRDRVETAAVKMEDESVCCAALASAALVRYRRTGELRRHRR